MKIFPLANYNIYTKPAAPEHNRIIQRNLQETTYAPLMSAAYYPVNFKGSYTNLQNQLLMLDGVHCPCCGEETVSSETAADIVEAAGKAQNLQQYSEVLNNNIEYLHEKYYPFVKALNRFAQNYPQKSIPQAISILRYGSTKLVLNSMHDQAKYLDELSKSKEFSNPDREKLKTCADFLASRKNLPKKTEYSEMLGKTLGSLETEKRKSITFNVNNSIMIAYNCRGALFYDPAKSKGLSEQAAIVKNMLSYSVSKLARIYDSKPDHLRFNNILLCKECNTRFRNFSYITNSPQAEEKLNQYVNDIADAIKDNKLAGNNMYLYDFIGAVNGFGTHRILLKRTALTGVVQNKIFSERKRGYMFEHYRGIPCASCGTTTITHDEKLDLFDEIKKCENLYELYNFVKLNSQHIVPKYKIILQRFEKKLKENPSMNEKEILRQLQAESKKDITKYMDKVCSEIENTVKNGQFNFVEKGIISDFIYTVNRNYKNMPPEAEFRYDDFNNLIEKTLGTLHHPDRAKLISFAKNKLKEIYMQDYIIHPPEDIVRNMDSEFKVVFQNIFKMSVITVEHMDPLALGGADEYYNKIGYCKDCNNEKGRLPLNRWAKKHPEVNQNIPKHLKFISGIIKGEHIKEMYDYPEQAAIQAAKLGKGEIHIPKNYGFKD